MCLDLLMGLELLTDSIPFLPSPISVTACNLIESNIKAAAEDESEEREREKVRERGIERERERGDRQREGTKPEIRATRAPHVRRECGWLVRIEGQFGWPRSCCGQVVPTVGKANRDG